MRTTVRVFTGGSPSPLRDTDPKVVGGWSLVGRLGVGGMGTVYLALGADHKPVAVKVLHPHLAEDPTFLARFTREAELAQSVRARCTATVLDVDSEALRPYLVTEYVAGPTLSDRISEGGPLTGTQVTGLTVGLAEALAGIHEAGIVHRDLTPRNVILAADGPRIIDFGIARSALQTSLTATGMTMGTPGWLAPEVLRGDEATPAADMFALGALSCFAASGASPFGAGPTEAILFRVAHAQPALPEDLPEGLTAIVSRCLDKDPDARPTSALVVQELAGASTDPGEAVTQLLERTWQLPIDVETLPVDTTGHDPASEAKSRAADEPTLRRRWLARLGVGALMIAGAAATFGVLTLVFNGDEGPASPDPVPTEQDEAEPEPDATDEPAAHDGTTPAAADPVDPDPQATSFDADLPTFHEEIYRTVAPRDDVRAVLVASAPREREPRPVTFTLFEWDRGEYHVADQVEIDCGFLTRIESDHAGLTYLDCTAGATAHWLWALMPDTLSITTHPSSFGDPDGGWIHNGWERIRRDGQPDDLIISYSEYAPEGGRTGRHYHYVLEWDSGYQHWQGTECITTDGQRLTYDPPWPASSFTGFAEFACH